MTKEEAEKNLDELYTGFLCILIIAVLLAGTLVGLCTKSITLGILAGILTFVASCLVNILIQSERYRLQIAVLEAFEKVDKKKEPEVETAQKGESN